MQDLRCTCGRLLGKGEGAVQIKCHRCGTLNDFADGKRKGEPQDGRDVEQN